MEVNQKIHCSVESCKYKSETGNLCTLQAIHVTPVTNKDTKKPDESMCSSYEYERN